MKIIRNDTPAPLSAGKAQPGLLSLTVRFAVLLAIAVVLMALAWSQ